MVAFARTAPRIDASWAGNFRDLNASVTRMATLAPGGRINREVVDGEIERLRRAWRLAPASGAPADAQLLEVLGERRLAEIDLFDRVQLAAVVEVCRRSKSLSEAGRTLFAASLARRSSSNDADRLRKYLSRFDLEFRALQSK